MTNSGFLTVFLDKTVVFLYIKKASKNLEISAFFIEKSVDMGVFRCYTIRGNKAEVSASHLAASGTTGLIKNNNR